MKRYVIINVNLQYEIPEEVKTEEQVEEFIENIELPKQYVEDSFDLINYCDENGETIGFRRVL